jgi:hypothetical protein
MNQHLLSRISPLAPRGSLGLVLALAACPAPVNKGSLEICTHGIENSGDDTSLDVSGSVSNVNDGTTDCAAEVTLESDTNEAWTFGITVTSENDEDITPELDLEIGDAVDLSYRYRMVWGSVAGMVISDADGLVLAADQGSWGEALSDEDTPGFTVSRSADPVAVEQTACEPMEGYAIIFEGDDTQTITPVDSAALMVDGTALTAMAIRATEYGESATCATSDTTGFLSWVLVR